MSSLNQHVLENGCGFTDSRLGARAAGGGPPTSDYSGLTFLIFFFLLKIS